MWNSTRYFDLKMSQNLWNMSHDTRVCASCHAYAWGILHIWMTHVSHTNELCHTHEWDMHVTHTNDSCHTYEWVMSHIRMSHVTHTNESCHTYEWVMSLAWMRHVTWGHVPESCHTAHEPSGWWSFDSRTTPQDLVYHQFGSNVHVWFVDLYQ